MLLPVLVHGLHVRLDIAKNLEVLFRILRRLLGFFRYEEERALSRKGLLKIAGLRPLDSRAVQERPDSPAARAADPARRSA